ncbi:MAG: FKBP-type peptidyl-prolyl cis-trans isomerase [Bacteroidota bacterium]
MRIMIATILSLTLLSCSGDRKKAELKTAEDSVSYSIGVDIGLTLQNQDIKVEADPFLQGLLDASDTSAERMMTDEQIQKTMMAFQQRVIEQRQKKMSEQSASAKVEGDAFLAENKAKPGVVTTASGLQYKVVTMGKGKKPKATDNVTVHYSGRLINGMVFDNSYDRGEPVTFPVNGVIAGWTEVLQLMPVGSKWEVVVPSKLGYGDNPAGPIPPGSTLIFDVELLAIKK